jgi:hypothetical protein
MVTCKPAAWLNQLTPPWQLFSSKAGQTQAHAADLFQIVHGSSEHGQAPQAGDGVCQVPLGIVKLHKTSMCM